MSTAGGLRNQAEVPQACSGCTVAAEDDGVVVKHLDGGRIERHMTASITQLAHRK